MTMLPNDFPQVCFWTLVYLFSFFILLPPGQEILVNAVKTNLPTAEYEEYKKTLQMNNRDLGIDKALKEYDVDDIVGQDA